MAATVEASRFEDQQRAGGVDLVGGHRVSQRPGNRGTGRQVHHGVGFGDDPGQEVGVEDGPLHQFDAVDSGEVGRAPGREVVESHDAVYPG